MRSVDVGFDTVALLVALASGCGSDDGGGNSGFAGSGGSAAVGGLAGSGSQSSGGTTSSGGSVATSGGTSAGGTTGGSGGSATGCTPDATFCSGSEIRLCTASGADSTLTYDCAVSAAGLNELLTTCGTCSAGTRCVSDSPFATVTLTGIENFSSPADGCELTAFAYLSHSTSASSEGALYNGFDNGTTRLDFQIDDYLTFPSGTPQTVQASDMGTVFFAFESPLGSCGSLGTMTFTLTHNGSSVIGSPIKIEASATFSCDTGQMIPVTYVYDGQFTYIDTL